MHGGKGKGVVRNAARSLACCWIRWGAYCSPTPGSDAKKQIAGGPAQRPAASRIGRLIPLQAGAGWAGFDPRPQSVRITRQMKLPVSAGSFASQILCSISDGGAGRGTAAGDPDRGLGPAARLIEAEPCGSGSVGYEPCLESPTTIRSKDSGAQGTAQARPLTKLDSLGRTRLLFLTPGPCPCWGLAPCGLAVTSPQPKAEGELNPSQKNVISPARSAKGWPGRPRWGG